MKLDKKIYVIEKMSKLIEIEKTGNAEEFAEKLGISRSQLFIELDDLKAFNVDIKYSRSKHSFVYTGNKRIITQAPILVVDRNTTLKIKGGSNKKNATSALNFKQLVLTLKR
ncbi:hypothetical protein [Roseimarinus sediminis]|jgi:hypothetical protein|uniref:hypothetical protein n=1 Tax=Roseimarinus sediminis TaxID=1610899 RepID=UPI003D24C253